MAEEMKQNPEILRGKRRIGIFLLIWITSRVAVGVSEFLCVRAGFFEFEASNIAGFIAAFVFALGIYQGAKPLAALPILGGAVMLVQVFLYDYLTVMLSNEYYTLARVYTFLFLLSSGIQTAGFLFLVVSKKTNLYFAAHKKAEVAAKKDVSVSIK